MNWKLPDVFQRSVDYFKLSGDESQRSPSQILHEEEDDLGISHVCHKGTVPFLRVESAVHNFIDVALPAHLSRLHQHQSNIKKWRKLKDFSKLQTEYINAGRTVQQLTRNITDMETLRARVIEDDLTIFDKHLSPATNKALEEIHLFFSIHGEQLNDNGDVKKTDEKCPVLTNDFSNRDIKTAHDDCNTNVKINNSINDDSSDRGGFARLQGNRIVFELNNEQSSEEVHVTDLPTFLTEGDTPNHNHDTKSSHIQDQLIVEKKENPEVDEWWDKLRKDIIDLNDVMKDFSSIVHDQGKMVDDISSNVEKAKENIKDGTSKLKKASILKAAMFPIIGAVVGGVVGGPLGMVAGLKLGSVTTGLAAAGVTGTVIGYQGGKAIRKRQDFAMEEMGKRNDDSNDDGTGSFEIVENNRI